MGSGRRARAARQGAETVVGQPDTSPSQRVLIIPLVFALALAALALLPPFSRNYHVVGSLWSAFGLLVLWNAVLFFRASYQGRRLTAVFAPRPQHYLQACAQGAVFLYWGWYWREVYTQLPFIGAQLLFAYGVDTLLTWWRRDTCPIGFGPFPIVFSINLFLWFRQDWLYLQFLLILVGLLAKELIRWERDGRLAHIFNPSSFPLAVASILLIVTRSTGMTWGAEIASTQFLPPHIYLVLFLVGLPGQLLFGVTTMTMSAVVTTYAFGLAYFAVTGSYYFFDSYIPIAVFLGMHLLFTDPSTSPRTELGRIGFGMLYGLGTVAFYAVLGVTGAPTFYDKLLPVPILNLSVRAIDRVVRSGRLRWLDPAAIGRALAPRRRHLAYIVVWLIVFTAMSAAQGVGDVHRGYHLGFWDQACRRGVRGGCVNLATMEARYCAVGSAWACNELGMTASRHPGVTPIRAEDTFGRACVLGVREACANGRASASGSKTLRSVQPRQSDYAIVLQEGKATLATMTPAEMYQRACDYEWGAGCDALAGIFMNQSPRTDPLRAVSLLDRGCKLGNGDACSNLGLMYHEGNGIFQNDQYALFYLRLACGTGMPDACQWLQEQQQNLSTK